MALRFIKAIKSFSDEIKDICVESNYTLFKTSTKWFSDLIFEIDLIKHSIDIIAINFLSRYYGINNIILSYNYKLAIPIFIKIFIILYLNSFLHIEKIIFRNYSSKYL